jgi:hypothetical protein
MSNYIKGRDRYHPMRAMAAPVHKFTLGVRVSYHGAPGSGLYRVTRHLPDGGQGLQYRIRSERDGQERVVVESALKRTTWSAPL